MDYIPIDFLLLGMARLVGLAVAAWSLCSLLGCSLLSLLAPQRVAGASRLISRRCGRT